MIIHSINQKWNLDIVKEYRIIMNLRIFKYEGFGEIRWVKVKNKDYAAEIYIAKALGYKKPNDAISRYCGGSVKHGVGVVSGKRKDGTDPIQLYLE